MVALIKILFWLCFLLVIYTYAGYGLVLYLLIRLKRRNTKASVLSSDTQVDNYQPGVTFIVAAYNEETYIEDKIANSLAFDYPKDKIEYFFVTDGSDDNTPELIRNYDLPEGIKLRVFHKDERKGKIAAVHRIMEFVETPIVVFTDANTMVNKEAVQNIVRHYADPKVGAVAGEKRIMVNDRDAANAAGEGFYWKYESALKKWDSELYSVVGAAGELFSIRTGLYQAVPPDTIIEDFYMTLRIAQNGYRVVYEPEAYALEGPSASVQEELKRKIRIAAGGIQSILRLKPLLNIFKYGTLSFQYISHRVLRWTITPIALPLLFLFNLFLVCHYLSDCPFYKWTLWGQIIFYLLALIGYFLEKRKIKIKAFFIPYYFCIMNYAVYRGFIRMFNKSQSVVWEKAKRA